MSASRQFRRLPRYMAEIQQGIERHAVELGLDFYTIIFEVLSFEEMNEVASYGGFPKRYPHWRFGMEYERMHKSSTYGLHRIYEMVINNDPCYAYLLEGNSLVDQKMVMAHVMAHCDFFKNNLFFAHTSRKMMDEMANHGSRLGGYMDRLGRDKVETFLDSCLSIDNLIDPVRGPGMLLGPESDGKTPAPPADDPDDMPSYMRAFVHKARSKNEKVDQDAGRDDTQHETRHADRYGQDVMGFLLHNAPLSSWEQSVLDIARREAYYFAPQGQTKIMNEGWATFWHSKIMTERVLTAADVIEYADHASGVLATSGRQLNPYKLGVEMYRHIVEKWDLGRFGKKYDECQDAASRAAWNTHANKGMEKIFEVRRCYNDITFIDEFFDEEFCLEQNMFTYGYKESAKRNEIVSRSTSKVKQALLSQLTNLGNPIIRVRDANHENRGELLLAHQHEGVDLRHDWARDVLSNLVRIWRRPVRIDTVMAGKSVHLRYDGRDHAILSQGEEPEPPEDE